MWLDQAEMWDPQSTSKHASLLPQPPHTNPRNAHLTRAAPAKRITFYKSGDSKFGGVKMAVHKRSFKCFDALLDDLSQKMPLPFGVRTVTTPRGTHTIKHLEQLQDGGCYLCSDQRQAKPINMELASKRPNIWHHYSQRPYPPETTPPTAHGHLPYRQRRILLVKNREPGVRRSMVLSRSSARSLKAFLDEASEVMQFHVRKLYTTEGRRINNAQSLMTCPGILVCVGRESFSPLMVNFTRKTSEEKLPSLGSRSSGLDPRTPGNGARSPATQGARSPIHGAQSRSSEYSDGHESKKNVNFGLETKKSIIHPRSDSSNRSTHFSLSSEKSYSQSKPGIMNDDIEKRVLVNKDGSLSVEMRVRFRLQNDETLQWSTQIKKSPSLINECCPLSQDQPHYLQHGQSESCSDPDSTSFDPECMDYSSQQQHVIEGNYCPCCYQRQKPQYDLWENPAHINNQHPVPPPYTTGHTHTIVRHTHSSSSSSSCNSRRVVRCRARLSKCAEGSGLEPSQLIQKEMCVTEQVERTVEVEQNGDTHVEVCRVSRCSEVVALDSNLRSLSGKSGDDRLLMEDEEKHPMSAVSSSSHGLQLLKEDQDDDLPPSASQCSCRNEPSLASETGSFHSCQNKHNDETETEGRATASLSHCKVATPHSSADTDEMHETQRLKPAMSRASLRSSKAEAAASEEVSDDEDEEIMRVDSGLSGHMDGSLKSGFCPHCGGIKRPVNSVLSSRSSKRSHRSQNASSPLPSRDHTNKCTTDDDDDASNVSGVSTKSNKTNISSHGCVSASNATQSRACSATSKMSNPEPKDEERASVKGRKSNMPHRSDCNGTTGLSDDKERIPSPMSPRSRKSRTSTNNGATDVGTKEEDLGDNERATSSLSAKTNPSVKLCINDASQYDTTTVEVGTADKKPARPDSVASAKSNMSNKTNQSQRSMCSKYATAQSPCADEATPDKLQGEGDEIEERAASTNSHQSCQASERSFSPSAKPEDRSMTKMSGHSVKCTASVKSSKLCTSTCEGNETKKTLNSTEREQEEGGAIEEKTQQAESVAGSIQSNENAGCTSESKDLLENDDVQEKAEIATLEERTHSAMSGSIHSAATPSCPQKLNSSAPLDPRNEDGIEVATSAMSAKSKSSARSSHRSRSGRNVQVTSPNASSALSHKSSHNGANDVEETAELDQSPSPKSIHSPNMNSSKVAPTPSSSRSPVQQLLPDPSISETTRPSALSVLSVKSAKSRSSRCSCGTASSTNEMEEEDKDVKSERLPAQSPSILSPKRLRKESGGTEEPLSRNSSGSISIGLPEDTASSDSWKSNVSERNRAKTRSHDVAVKEDVDRLSGSVVSQRSNFNESKSTHDLPIINIGQSHESGEQNPVRESRAVTSKSNESRSIKSGRSRSARRPKSSHVDEMDNRALSTASSASAQIKHVAKTPEGDYMKNISRPISKNKDIENDNATSILSKSPSCLSPDVAPLDASIKSPKATSNRSGKSSSSKRKEASTKSQSPCPAPNTSPARKSETCSGSTLSHSLSAADMLKETVAAARPSSHQSKNSKTSTRPRSEKHREPKNKTPYVDLELTPTCLPNASPNEVVSEWLKSIPADSSMLDFSDDLLVAEEHEKVEENPVEETAEDEGTEDKAVDEGKKSNHLEEEENEGKELNVEGAAGDTVVSSQPKTPLMCNDSVPRNWQSSAAVMKVLLSSSLGRCQSLPEVSPVYGRRLSTSAKGFLDCLAQLQLIEPAVHPGCDQPKGHWYEDIMTILQSLWLIEPRDVEAKEDRDIRTDQVTPPRSSSGVDMSSGSGGSGKDMVANQGGDEAEQNHTSDTVSLHADEPDVNADQNTLHASVDSPKATENPSVEKSSPNDSSKSPTDNEGEISEETSMGSPSAVLQTLTRKPSQEPDPVWILKLLKKLEKQFMNHYVNAMAEFKVRWDLDDSVILNTMITELRDEVSQRIQSSIAREIQKIQSRAGRMERSACPPREPNLSRDSSMIEKRRRMMRVMKNQSKKTADSFTDEEMMGDFSDQRSEDEYCPCDACVRKKMASRPLKTNPDAAEAPVMMEFDLLKILQLKKSPLPPDTAAKEEEVKEVVAKEEGRSLEVVQEEEEEMEEIEEDIKDNVILEETILEENEEVEEDEVVAEVEKAESECQCVKDEEKGQEGEEETSNDVAEEELNDEQQSKQETGKEATGAETAKDEEVADEEGGESGRENAEDESTENKATSNKVSEDKTLEAQDEEDDIRGEESHDEAKGGGSDEREASEETDAVQGLEFSKPEEADDTVHSSDSNGDESREVEKMDDEDTDEMQKGEGSKKGDGALQHQFTRTSVESQPGSLEDVDLPPNTVSSIEVPKTGAGGGGGSSAGQRRSRSPARVKRRKPKECDEEDF